MVEALRILGCCWGQEEHAHQCWCSWQAAATWWILMACGQLSGNIPRSISFEPVRFLGSWFRMLEVMVGAPSQSLQLCKHDVVVKTSLPASTSVLRLAIGWVVFFTTRNWLCYSTDCWLCCPCPQVADPKKARDAARIGDKILEHLPHAIIVGAGAPQARQLKDDVEKISQYMEQK